MSKEQKIPFQFGNNTSPKYIDTLFLSLQPGQWYTRSQLIDILRATSSAVEGEHIVSYNTLTWSLLGLGELKTRKGASTDKNIFQITESGKQLIDIYSTHPGLFYDLIHFLLYSAYRHSYNLKYSRFWLYQAFCNTLWEDAPKIIETQIVTNRLQIEFRGHFPEYDASFNDRSIQSIFPWLRVLNPPFLTKTKGKTWAERRLSCTTQLFHLATDFVYRTVEQLEYGTSLAINQAQIETICRVCLLDPEQFWNMAGLTQMTFSGFEVRQGQWEKAIVLDHAPDWISLPDFTKQQEESDFEEGDKG